MLQIAIGPVQTDKTKESIAEIQKELTQINNTKLVTDDEFEKEQKSAILSVPVDWETISGVNDFIVNMVTFKRGKDYAKNYSTMLQNFTVNNIQTAAAKVINPATLTWLIVGDRSKIEKGIQELNVGTIKYLDADGNEIK